MRTLLLLLMLCCSLAPLAAQPAPEKLHTVPGSWTNFEVDNLGNLYLLGSDMQLRKFNDQLDSMGVFNEVRNFGTLHTVDASNPLRIILWYKDFATLVILDRFLNRRTIIDLRQAGILQCEAIAQSYDNNIWLYDDLDAKVKKINEEGTVLLESADFRVLFDTPPRPFKLEDYNKKLYAYDSTRGLMVMDYFGAYQQILSHQGWRQLQGYGKGLLAADARSLTLISPDGINTRTIPLPPQWLPFRKMRVQAGKLYLLSEAGILTIYALPAGLQEF